MEQLNISVSSQKSTVKAFFEVSPVRKVKSGPAKILCDHEEEKAELVLKPFAAKPRLVFKGVHVGNKCSQSFLVTNPDPTDVTVDITLPNCNLQIESCRFQVPAKSSVDVNLTWLPKEQGTFTESIQIKDSKGRRGTVSLALEAIVQKPLKGTKKNSAAKVPLRVPPVVKSRTLKAAPPAKAKPAWQDPLPARAPREALRPVSAQQIQPTWSAYKEDVQLINESVDDAPLRRETFVVCGKENDGSPALPKTPARDLSVDSLEPTPKTVKSTTKRQKYYPNKPAVLNDILKEFTLSPLVKNLVTVTAEDNFILESQPAFDPTLPSISEIETPCFDARRCSTAFKQLTEDIIRKPRGVSPRELFNADMHPDVPECRLSSATYIADRRDSNETYIADRRASSDTYVADKRLSSDTYVAEKRLSTDTYVLSNSHSFEGASGDSTVLQNTVSSPAPRAFTPVLSNVEEEMTEDTPKPEAWEIVQTGEAIEVDEIDFHILPQEEMSGIGLQNYLNDSTLTVVNSKTPENKRNRSPDPSFTFSEKKKRKRCGLDLDSIQFTPLGKDDGGEGPSRYNLRSAGKVVHIQEVQTLSSVTMDFSPPKKFKLPAPSSTERCSNETIMEKTEKVDKTFILVPASSAMFVPYSTKKKLTLQQPVKKETEEPSESDEELKLPTSQVDDILMEFAMAKMSTPGLQEDPFYMNPLLTDAIIDKYDTDFKKWLNSVVTPPEELESADLIKVNAAELWSRSSKSEEMNLAPTKEMVSSKYLSVKSRLDQLRHAAYNLFCKDEMKKVLCCVNSRVDNGKIKIRSDKALHIDQGLKHGILGLFMSYNPLWLRIGLETVCGTLIPMRTNTDVQTISYYIITRILGPEAVVGKSHLLLKKECKEKYDKFVAKKFLMLVYFLDKAKMSKMIRHDPCLFLKNSMIKTSKEMLITFSRMLLAGEGDITKHLGYMGYKVSYVQGYLDEFNYSVKHLGVDLRDGVRITRVVELVTGTMGLSVNLRVPAISRLQKIHNVGVALKCLESNGFTVKNLTATDIVMGHREKTLSLIWQIIHNFQVPRFNKAASLIQQWWLHPSLKTVIERRILKKKILKATLVFQKYTRGFLCRKNLDKIKTQLEEQRVQNASAVVIQRAYRRFFLRSRAAREEERSKKEAAARKILSFLKVIAARKTLHQLRTEAAIKKAAQRESATLKIQTHVRRMLAQRQLRVLRAEHVVRVAAVTKIQCFWRRSVAQRELGLLKEEHKMKSQAATVLQRCWRMKKAKEELERLRAERFEKESLAASILQRAWRCFIARKLLALLQEENEQRRNQAATLLQTAWRGVLARKSLHKLREQRNAAITIQCAWRQLVAMRILQELRVEEIERRKHEASVKIQCAWRCFAAKRVFAQLQAEDLTRKNLAATKIQCSWKSFLARRELERLRLLHQQKREAAALALQCSWRVHLARRILHQLQDAAQKQVAAVKIQCSWRCFVARKTLQELRVEAEQRKAYLAAVKIQTAWRCYMARQLLAQLVEEEFERRTKAATMIQTAWRGKVARCQLQALKKEWIRRNRSATLIQTAWRGKVARTQLHTLKKELEMKRNAAATILQCAWKCFFAKKLLAQLKERESLRRNRSATLIQTAWRSKIARTQLQTLKKELEMKRNSAATVLQCAWKCCLAKKLLAQLKEEESLRRNRSATLIQTAWRGKVARRQLEALKHKRNCEAATTIQCAWRCFVSRRLLALLVQEDSNRRNKAATKIQTAWRGKIARVELQRLKVWKMKTNTAATCIQCAWRCFVSKQMLSRLREEDFERRTKAAIRIQCFWRCIVAKQELAIRSARWRQINEAALVIQLGWRSFLARRVLSQLKHEKRVKAALKIQTNWRRHIAARELEFLREEWFQQRTRAATLIQSSWRKCLAQRQLSALKLQRDNSAALKIQLCWRQYIARNELNHLRREKLTLTNKSAETIQCAWRCFLARRMFVRLRDEKQNKAAVRIQCAWRCQQARKVLQALKQELEELRCIAATRIQCAFRCHMAQKELGKLRVESLQKREAAAVKLQSHFRRFRSMQVLKKLRQERFEKRSRAAVTLQKTFRGRLARQHFAQLKAEIARKQTFEVQNKAAHTLQNFFRMLLWRKAVATTHTVRRELLLVDAELQMWHRILLRDDASFLSFKILLSVLRSQYSLRMKHHLCARFIQQKWRMHRYRRRRAATKIQALWRGFKCRKNIRLAAVTKEPVVITDHQVQQEIKLDKNVASQLVKKCDQIKESSKNAKEEQTVGYKIIHALQNWQKTFDFEIGTYTLFNRCLGVSGSLVMLILPGVPMVIDGFLSNNRSVPAMNLAVQASEILLSVAKYPDALPYLKQMDRFIHAILFNLNISATANEKLFLNCSTILWVLAHDNEMKQKILAEPNLKFKFTSLRPKIVKAATRQAVKIAFEMPSMKLHKSPRSFSNKQHAFQAVLKILGMKL